MKHFKHVWAWPIGLGVATAIGLTLALLGDGLWDQLSAVALGAPVAVCLWYGLARRSPKARDSDKR